MCSMRIATVLVFAAILLAVGSSVRSWQNAPRVEFVETELDAGELTLGQRSAHLFRFSNEGTGALVIERLRPDCSVAAAATLASSSVMPGGMGSIQVEFDSSSSEPGQFERFVDVMTNDPKQPVARLRIFGTVQQEFGLSRAAIDFGDVKAAEGSRAENVSVTTDAKGTIRVVSVKSSDPRITAHVVERADVPGPNLNIVAAVAPNSTPGWIMGNIVVATDSRVSPTVLIPVRGRVLSPQNDAVGSTPEGP